MVKARTLFKALDALKETPYEDDMELAHIMAGFHDQQIKSLVQELFQLPLPNEDIEVNTKVPLSDFLKCTEKAGAIRVIDYIANHY